MISNLKVYWKNTAPYIGNVQKRQKTSRNQSTMIKQPRKGITRKRRYTQTPFEKSRKEKRLKLKNGPIAILKASQIPFPPDTPHQTVRHNPPNNYVTMSPEVTRPAIQQVHYLCGITQQIPNKQKIILHTSNAIGQWRRRWSTISPHLLHIKHHSGTTKCLF